MLLADIEANGVTDYDTIEEEIKMLKSRLRTVFQDSINDDETQTS